MNLSNHEKKVIEYSINANGWVTQNELKSSRQTMNKLVKAGIFERKLNREHTDYMPESGSLYRIKDHDKAILAFQG